jgi:hypothetical protein
MGPVAAFFPQDQPGLAQYLQVLRDSRFRDPQVARQRADAQIAVQEFSQDF